VLARASALDRLGAIFVGLVLVFAAAAWPRLPRPAAPVVAYGALLGLLVAAGWFRFSRARPAVRSVAMLVYPVVFLLGVFESFVFVMPWFREARFDAALIEVDHAVFGVHPTVWMERLTTPWLTDAMYLLYALYFPLPLLVLVPLLVRGRHEVLDRALFRFLFCFLGAYVVCFFVPAEGPRYHLAHAQTVPLEGVALAGPIRDAIDRLEPNKLDAFPSLHAAIVLFTMVFAWREARRAFWVLLPFAVGIAVSLVYCRYHYVVDVAAGFAWAAIAYPLGGWLHARLRPRCAPHFGPAA
jgi:membrane-associated phospholipid phosphatase